MQGSIHHIQNISSLEILKRQSLNRMGSRRSQIATGQHISPVVYPEKRGKIKSARQKDVSTVSDDPGKAKTFEHRIDIDEHSDLLGYDVFSGKLALVKKSRSISNDEQTGPTTANLDSIDAKLSSKALVWGSQTLYLEDVVSVSYTARVRHFTVHSYPLKRRSCGLSCILKPRRSKKDFCFLASSPEEAIQWVTGFADQQCFLKSLPHPTVSSKKQPLELPESIPLFDQLHIKCKRPPKVLIILNPQSGHGRSSKVFHAKVEPIFELAGFKMEVVKTTAPGHAKKLASTVDLSTCPDGIICVGGDGIVNEVLNGLFSRDNQKEAISVPIGIIPAGSDNSLAWTILGVRDPISAAMTIVKGGLTVTDVFAVEWIQTGIIHYGTTVSYFGFLSDVLELSEKYQKRFGPLRYFVAGFLKFLCLPKYNFEVEYLPTLKEVAEDRKAADDEKLGMSEVYTDATTGSTREGSLPRASSLSSIDSVMTPTGRSGSDLDTAGSSTPSEFVRCLDPKSKRLSSGRSNVVSEPEEVIHPQLPLSTTPNWPRTRSKSRADKGWAGLNIAHDSRSSCGGSAMNDREDISSTISDPGPIWDSEPKWDTEPTWDPERHWEAENPINFPGPPPDNRQPGLTKELVPILDEEWVVKKGTFLGILVCNHSCKTVQSLSSQVIAPKAVHDDNALDLLLIQGNGRLRLLRFFILLQFGRHLSLPYVEYVKVKSVKLRASRNNQQGCGIDGELIKNNGQVMCSLLPEQCRLIGRPARNPV